MTLALPATSAPATTTAAHDATTARTQRALTLSHGRRGPPDIAASSDASQVHGETIHTTANHLWLSADRGWVDAGQLHVDEPMRLLDLPGQYPERHAVQHVLQAPTDPPDHTDNCLADCASHCFSC